MDSDNLKMMWKVMREHNLEIVDDNRSDFLCTICHLILVDACNAPCGCRFCMNCIDSYLKAGQKHCPGKSSFCHLEFIDMSRDIQVNRLFNNTISRLIVKCPYSGCSSKIELKSLTDHMRICHYQPKQCPYSNLGCNEEQKIYALMNEHLASEMFSHSTMLMNWMNNCHNEMDSMRKDLDKVKTENRELKDQIRSVLERTENIIGQCEKKENEKNENSSMQILQSLIDRTNYGEFVWKIDNWLDKKNSPMDKIEYSDSFFSHQNGYKIRLCFWSDKSIFKKTICVSFNIIPGPFDDILNWPFTQNVQFSLINPDYSSTNHTWTMKYLDKHHHAAFQKPSQDVILKPSRNSYFISLEQLSKSSPAVKNNQIYIKFSMINKD